MCSPCESGYIKTTSPVENDEVAPEGERLKLPRDQEYGIRNPRKLMDPRLSSKTEVDEHKLSHPPHRNWCPHCVAGKGKMAPRFTQSRVDGLLHEY